MACVYNSITIRYVIVDCNNKILRPRIPATSTNFGKSSVSAFSLSNALRCNSKTEGNTIENDTKQILYNTVYQILLDEIS